MDQERIWYVVMNSNRARILRGLPEPHAPAASELSLQSRHLRLRDHLQDKPTRSFSSGSPGRRSAVEPSSDPLREDLLRFLHDVQDFLAGERQANAFDSLVVVAPAEVIGLWRQALHEPLASVIRAELRKNLIHLSAHDLIEVLRDTPKTHSAYPVTESCRLRPERLRRVSRVILTGASRGTNCTISAAMPCAACAKLE